MTTALLLLQQIEVISHQQRELVKQKDALYQQLKVCKSQIEKDHAHLIGRRANCWFADNPKPAVCVCNAVRALDDYTSVTPLFISLGAGRKMDVEVFDWLT